MSGTDRGASPQRIPPAAELIERADLRAALKAVSGVIVPTPAIVSPELSELLGSPVHLKAECLQGTGSFKLRGVLARVAALGDGASAGLITASAGNHARAVAHVARLRGVACEVFMPRDAPASKVAAVEALGARVSSHGDSVDEALELAIERSTNGGAAFIHPFDDLDVIAGQATLGLELLEQVPDLARVLIPVGGGGLASGIGIAMRQASARVGLIGVQAAGCAPYAEALGGAEVRTKTESTIADGIAVKRPGALTFGLLRELLDDVRTVTEDEIADGMVFLAERGKLISEGAGAVAVASLLSSGADPVGGATVAIVSGGNVDSGLLAALLLRHEAEEGRRVRIVTRVPDRPGGLAELLRLVASSRANVVSVEHVREAQALHVRETGVVLTLETRGPQHTDEVLLELAQAGYEAHIA
jgi:threonine dehydratase